MPFGDPHPERGPGYGMDRRDTAPDHWPGEPGARIVPCTRRRFFDTRPTLSPPRVPRPRRMTKLQRACFWLICACWTAAVVLVQFVIYNDTPQSERLVYT